MTKEQAEALAREIEEDYEQPYSVDYLYERAEGGWCVVVRDRPRVVRSENDWKHMRRSWVLGAAA